MRQVLKELLVRKKNWQKLKLYIKNESKVNGTVLILNYILFHKLEKIYESLKKLNSYCILSGPTKESSQWKGTKIYRISKRKRQERDCYEGIIGKIFCNNVYSFI